MERHRHHQDESYKGFDDLPSAEMYPLLGPNPLALINACFVLDTLGQIALTILIITFAFSSRVRKRNATLISLLVVTILCSIPPALLFYTQSIMNPTPPFGLCFSQAIFKNGTDPMFVVASFALIIEFLQGAGITVMRWIFVLRTPVLVAMPYFTFVAFATITAGLGGAYPKEVQHNRNRLYCWVNLPLYIHGVEIFSVIVVVITVSLEAFTIWKLRRNWRQLQSRRRVEQSSNASLFSLSQALRIVGFTILQLNYVILCGIDFYFHSVPTHILPILYDATMPLATFLIFGTTQDCLQAWMFWRNVPEPLEVATTPGPLDRMTFAPPSKANLNTEEYDGSQPITDIGRGTVVNIRAPPSRSSKPSTIRVSLPSTVRSSAPPPPLPPKDDMYLYPKSSIDLERPEVDARTPLMSPIGDIEKDPPSPKEERQSPSAPPSAYKLATLRGMNRYSRGKSISSVKKRLSSLGGFSGNRENDRNHSPTSISLRTNTSSLAPSQIDAIISPSETSPVLSPTVKLPDKCHFHLSLSLPPSGLSFDEFN